jgi:hypothetical protein
MFTEEILKNSKEFKEWVTGRVALIHNNYYDSEKSFATYIVLHSAMGKWTITRFWQSPNRKDRLGKIYANNDHVDISTEETFKILLSDYSRGLA